MRMFLLGVICLVFAYSASFRLSVFSVACIDALSVVLCLFLDVAMHVSVLFYFGVTAFGSFLKMRAFGCLCVSPCASGRRPAPRLI